MDYNTDPSENEQAADFCDEPAGKTESETQANETQTGHRPYMDYKPFEQSAYESEPDRQNPYRQNPYEQNPYWKKPYEPENGAGAGQTGFAIASLILGIIALCSCCLPVVTVPLGILAVVFAVPGMRSINRGIAIAGLVLGIIALVLGSMMLIILLLSAGGGSHHSWFWGMY
ncbi:MAG: DUF4190 domain-containing protein [Lachnospiraceae bacterium]|jgi:hypothetical protein|nr:DUF4190 domain-containing protein [Lachnospiraceae bacterium]